MKSLRYSATYFSKFLFVILCGSFSALFFFPGKLDSQNLQKAEEVQSEFRIRGFHIDLRCQVMTMPALKQFAKELADFGLNTLIMEWEGTFPFERHAAVSNQYAYTREEVSSFIEYCKSLGIEVIPLQQCFGHVEYILQHQKYAHLREDQKDISMVCPMKTEENRKFFSEVFSDLFSIHQSKYIHIGGDETFLLGHCGECAAKMEKEGKSKLYVDYIKVICDVIIDMGKIPVMWADIILKYPEASTELPKETVFIDWNYGWDINFFGNINVLQKQGLTFWGAPSIRCFPDNYYLTCWEKHFNNQRDFIPYARKAGYEGIIMTSWSTSGLYGFTWNSEWDVSEMHPVRNLYPLSGFRILVAGYSKALQQEAPINPREFVIEYCRNRFGFSYDDGVKFWHVITTSPEVIPTDKNNIKAIVKSINDSVSNAQKILATLKPERNISEFGHFRLMLDIRKHYLDYKALEAKYYSKNFSRNLTEELIPGAKELMHRSKELNQRYASLNKGFLYESEIEEQNAIRNRKLERLYAILTGNKRE